MIFNKYRDNIMKILTIRKNELNTCKADLVELEMSHEYFRGVGTG